MDWHFHIQGLSLVITTEYTENLAQGVGIVVQMGLTSAKIMENT
jgi:hypothetical protein